VAPREAHFLQLLDGDYFAAPAVHRSPDCSKGALAQLHLLDEIPVRELLSRLALAHGGSDVSAT